MVVSVGSRPARRGTGGGGTATLAALGSNGLRRSGRRVTPAANDRFVAATEQLDTGAPVVSVMGEVDRATVSALAQTLLGVAEDRTGDVIVDTRFDELFEIYPSPGAAVDRAASGSRPLPPTL
jgi:hypothetical protein